MRFTLNLNTYRELLPVLRQINKTLGRPEDEALDIKMLEDATFGYKYFAIYIDRANANPEDDEIVFWVDDEIVVRATRLYAAILRLLVPAVLGFIAAVAAIARIANNDMEDLKNQLMQKDDGTPDNEPV